MASEVFSGSSNFSYKNNTGQNVRVVINYMSSVPDFTKDRGAGIISHNMAINWAGVGVQAGGSTKDGFAIGRNLATISLLRATAGGYSSGAVDAPGDDSNWLDVASSASNGNLLGPMYGGTTTMSVTENRVFSNSLSFVCALPTEIMLRPGQTFSATCGVYNVVVIPENG